MIPESVIGRAACLLALVVAAVLLASCGGGGSSGAGGGGMMPSPLQATFTSGGPGDITLEPGVSSGADFDVEVRVNGPFNDFFGAAFRIELPAMIVLIAGSNGNGSFLLDGSPDTTFNAIQEGDEVLVVATRVQGAGKSYVPGVDVVGSRLLMTLKFRAAGPTAGALAIKDFPSREVRTCDDATETCEPEPDGNIVWSGGSVVAQ